MVREIIVLRESGVPLFNYHLAGEKRLDEIVAAFLSALGTMAEEVRKDQIKVMTFATNKFVWVHKGDLYFIALVSQLDSAEIYRVILQDLASKFVGTYYSELMDRGAGPKDFESFIDTVEATLKKFSGIPSLARRYKTALLSTDILSQIKEQLYEVESHQDIHRGSFITTDSFIVISNLRAYEMEDILDIIEADIEQTTKNEASKVINHPGLEKGTSFFVRWVNSKGVCAFVTSSDTPESILSRITGGFVERIRRIDLSEMKKVYPSHQEIPMAFYEYDVAAPLRPISEISQSVKTLFSELPKDLQSRIRTVLNLIDKQTTIAEIVDTTGLARSHIDEALAHLITQGLIRIERLYPILEKRDERFSAFLEVIGIAKKEYKVLDAIWTYCNGEHSIKKISRESGISVQRVLEALRSLGNQVKWKTYQGG